ncbi:MAG: FKBP-type peptidyl-prolyl cis-trans isomerase [Halothiobacillus sp.]|jgi:FKBP-type peptidyl-prolyl cis-trans isomerase SlpA|uniref:FKBP-type peptidyl-prolyl cis-trans isomerase n=1 Tax=Halothiobacillus sp. TaxID=1891311 RepID=UPI002AD2668B|nr:FKBP-type peptidyl-prolyl cis-trans isomerase [Halothiobacillus sp.]MDA3875826.1 FKBP-type peptidyl-prolyl cis-trans isomerase [Halothiobacillus sp.]
MTPQTTSLPVIQRGSALVLHYEIRLADDRVVDSTFGGEPFAFTLGDGSFAPILEESLLGLPLGEHTRILLTPEFAFGNPDPTMIHEVPRADVPDHLSLALDDVVEFDLPNGDAVAGTVRAINEDTLLVDFNHPMAGMNIQLVIQVLSIDGQRSEETV